MLYRPLGHTGERVSLLGLGGHHIGTQEDEQESIEIIRSAIDAGVTFLDNSWDYTQGKSEIRMGRALQDGYRERVFLMTKIDGRTRESAEQQLAESLERLQTDRIDLLQFHEVIRLEDPDRIFAPGGAMEAVEAARAAGKVRFIGFTGHKDPLVHLRMLAVAKDHGFRFDALQMPLNVMDAHFRSFQRHVLPVALAEGVAVIGMKPLGDGTIPRAGIASAEECLHYAMSLPVSVVLTGIDSMEVLRQDLRAVETFRPLEEDERAALLARTAESAKGGQYERFKTTSLYDATAHEPEWMGAAT
jgi:aryl-alcohol dehydrogenase-like predicted oxidoreductase